MDQVHQIGIHEQASETMNPSLITRHSGDAFTCHVLPSFLQQDEDNRLCHGRAQFFLSSVKEELNSILIDAIGSSTELQNQSIIKAD